MRQLRTFRRILAAIAVLAMSLHALVPVGFMPSWDETGDGGFALVICTSSGPVQVPFDTTGDFDEPSHNTTADCPYFAAASDAPVPSQAIVVQALTWPSATPFVAFEQAASVQRPGLPQPARGPPLHQTS